MFNEKKDEEVFADTILNNVNKFGINQKEIANCIRGGHRTLQQSFMRIIIAVLKGWQEDYKNGSYDLRNEATVKLADKIVNAFEDDMIVPYV